MDNIKHCSPEQFKALQSGPYCKYPIGLLAHILEELPDFVAVVYLRVFDLAQGNLNNPGTIIIPYGEIGKRLKKSKASIKRAIKTLEVKGYLKITKQEYGEQGGLPNIIQPLCPLDVLDKLLVNKSEKLS